MKTVKPTKLKAIVKPITKMTKKKNVEKPKPKPKVKAKAVSKLKESKGPVSSNLLTNAVCFDLEKSERDAKWQEYREYVDALVLQELQEAIRVSFNLILTEMTNEAKGCPLFEVRIEIQEPKIVFVPNLEMESSSGFCAIIETILEDIVGMAGSMPRIDEQNMVNFTDDVTDYYINSEMYDQILATVAHAVNSSLDFSNHTFDKYSYLWLDDRKKHLEMFLKYGKIVKKDDLEVLRHSKMKESYPKIDQFKEQLDLYENLLQVFFNVINNLGNFKLRQLFRKVK